MIQQDEYSAYPTITPEALTGKVRLVVDYDFPWDGSEPHTHYPDIHHRHGHA